MAGFSTTLRSNRATQIVTIIDAGAGAGLLKLYNGTQPATGGTATTLLATITCSKPCGTVAAGVLTFASFTSGTAVATSVATWGRISDSASTFVMDVTVGTSGTEIVLTGTNVITTGNTVSITSGTITEGNA